MPAALETNKSILIVEDEGIIAKDIQKTLEKFGYQIVGRESTSHGAIQAAHQKAPHLVLMDIRLKGSGDGISAAQQINDELGIPTVFLTAYADDKTLERAKITDPYGYVLKPFRPAELKTAIEIALYRSQRSNKERSNNINSDNEKITLTEEEQNVVELLANIEPFTQLTHPNLAIVAKGSKIKEFEAGKLIAFEDVQDYGFLVIQGRVAMVESSASGKDLIVETLSPGDPFGLFPTLCKDSLATTLRVQIRSKVAWVLRSQFLLVLDRNPELSQQIIAEVFNRLRSAHNLSRSLAHDLVEVRVASTLSSLISKSSRSAEQEDYVLQMTRQELAEMIGSTPETVIRTCKQMERDGLLDLSAIGFIRIRDLNKLHNVAEGGF